MHACVGCVPTLMHACPGSVGASGVMGGVGGTPPAPVPHSYCDAVRTAGEGCRMWGHLEVNKVAGNFHFAPGRSYQQGNMHVHDIAPFGDAHMDFS